mgnify:FL=1
MEKMSWSEKREMIEGDMADSFCGKAAGISREDFIDIFLASGPAPPIADFNIQYLGDETVLEKIFAELSDRTGLKESRIEDHYHREETFAQFGEHLLRAGAYQKGDS